MPRLEITAEPGAAMVMRRIWRESDSMRIIPSGDNGSAEIMIMDMGVPRL